MHSLAQWQWNLGRSLLVLQLAPIKQASPGVDHCWLRSKYVPSSCNGYCSVVQPLEVSKQEAEGKSYVKLTLAGRTYRHS
jgi:hypothetical protein